MEDAPEQLNTPGRRALYNNLRQGAAGSAISTDESYVPYGNAATDGVLALAIKIDETIKRTRPDGWRGVQSREQVIRGALYEVLQDAQEVEHIFLIIKQQKEY